MCCHEREAFKTPFILDSITMLVLVPRLVHVEVEVVVELEGVVAVDGVDSFWATVVLPFADSDLSVWAAAADFCVRK
jgi:hypothetical protein